MMGNNRELFCRADFESALRVVRPSSLADRQTDFSKALSFDDLVKSPSYNMHCLKNLSCFSYHDVNFLLAEYQFFPTSI